MTTPDAQETIYLTGTTGTESRDQFRSALSMRGHDYATIETLPVVLDVSGTTHLSGLFSGCAALTTIPALDTADVVDMSRMFDGCTSLTSLPVLETWAMVEADHMFAGTPLVDGDVRLIGRHQDLDTTNLLAGSQLTVLPFFTPEGHPWGTVNPSNSMTRADTFGIRPDLFQNLQEVIVKPKDLQNAAQEANAELGRMIDPENPDSPLWNIQWSINEMVNASLSLHDNQLKWQKWTATKQYFVEEPEDNEFFYATTAGSPTDRVDFVKRGTWCGEMIIQHRNHNGQVQWAKETIPPGAYSHQFRQGFDPNVSALHNAAIFITPYWGNDPREFLVQARENKEQGFVYTDAYSNGWEGNPVTYYSDDSIALSMNVIANQDIEILDVYDDWVAAPSGQTIYIGTRMRPTESSTGRLVKFTQILPDIDWGGSAPANGVENFSIEAQRLAYNTARTVKRWVAPEWAGARTIEVDYVIRWASVIPLATYEVRVLLNGERIWWTRSENAIQPPYTMRLERTLANVAPGDVFEFQVFTGSGLSNGREVSGGSLSIRWS